MNDDPRPIEYVREWLKGCDLPLLARTLLMDLSERAATTGAGWESASHLAARYGVHRSSVLRALRQVESAAGGLVERRRIPGIGDRWVFHNCAPTGAHTGEGGARPTVAGRAPYGREARAHGRAKPKQPIEPSADFANACESCDGTSFVSDEVVRGDRSVWESRRCPECNPKGRATG